MRYSSYKDFLKNILPITAPLILMLSSEEYETNLCLQKIKSSQPSSTFDSKNIDINSFKQELDSLSLFESHRIIIVQNIECASKDLLNIIQGYCQRVSEKISLVLSGSKISNKNISKAFEDNGVVLSIPAQKPWEKEESIKKLTIELLKTLGKSFSPKVVELLSNNNRDKESLNQEIRKLALYVGDKQYIDEQDFYNICAVNNEQNFWKLRDNIFSRQTLLAISMATEMIKNGEAVPAIIASLYYSFKTALQTITLFKQPNGVNLIAQKFPYMKGRVLQNQISAIKDYGAENLQKALILIAKYEFKSKNDLLNEEILIELLILKLTQRINYE